MEEFHELIKEICDELDVDMRILSKDWIIQLEKDNKTRYIAGYKFDLNGHAQGLVMDDKYAMYEVLKEKKIPVIEHQILFKNNNQQAYAKGCNSYEVAYHFFEQNHQHIVLKSNTSTCGLGVYRVTKREELTPVLDKLFKNAFSISMCPFYDIKREYRFIYLKNQCVLLYGKERPIVLGDGKKTIRELLQDFNPQFFQSKLQESKYNRVLTQGECYEYSWKFNLSEGAIPVPITDKRLQKRLQEFGNRISKKLDLSFCSVDVIEDMDGNLSIMELNSGVMMINYARYTKAGRKKAKEIYRQAIQEMFS